MKETDFMRQLMIATACDMAWLRNNVGSVDMNSACPHCGRRKDPKYGPRWIQYGCGGPGGSDLIGVQRSNGRAWFVETKSAIGRPTAEQMKFLSAVERAHAGVCLARTIEDFLTARRSAA